MAKRVALPDGSVGEFPDDMPDAQIEGVLRRQFGGPKPPEQKIDPAEGMGPLDKMLVGAGAAFARAGEGIASLYGKTGLPGSDDFAQGAQRMAEDRKAYEQAHPGGWATTGEVLGDVAMSAIPVGGAATAAGRAAGKALPRALARFGAPTGTVAANAGYGAATAPEDRGTAAAFGAGGALLGQGAQRVAGGLVKPLVTDDARALMARGVQPTVGQSLGGVANTIEQKAMSLPLVGDAARASRNRAVTEWNAAVNKAAAAPAARAIDEVPPDLLPANAGQIAAELRAPGVGDEALLGMRSNVGDLFNAARESAGPLRLDPGYWSTRVAEIANDPGLGLSEGAQRQFLRLAQNAVINRPGELSPGVAGKISSDLGTVANRYVNSSTADDRALGEALTRLKDAFDGAIAPSLPPPARELLRAGKESWRALLPVDKAADAAGSQSGVRGAPGTYSPRVLRQALAAQDKSQHDNLLRRLSLPGAPPRNAYEDIVQLSRQGMSLGEFVPDSGTAGRLAVGALGVGGAFGMGVGMPTLAAGGAAALGSLRAVQKALTQGLAPDMVDAFVDWTARQGIPEEVVMAQLPTLIARFNEANQRGYERAFAPQP